VRITKLTLGAILAALFTTSITAFAQTQIEPLKARRGGEVGSGSGSSDRMAHYENDGDLADCQRAIGILKRALRKTEYQDANYSALRRVLERGLIEAGSLFNPHDQSLTKQAIRRGQILGSVFRGGCPIDSNEGQQVCLEREQRTAVYFLSQFYTYIIDVIYPLDENYWYPTFKRCDRYDCYDREDRRDIYKRFHTDYTKAAQKLLGFYLGDDRNKLPEAFAMNTYELRAAERVLKWSADDLNRDLFRRSYACIREELYESAQDLADFNAGDREIFRNSRQAIEFARRAANSALRALDNLEWDRDSYERGSRPICRRW